MTAQPQRKHDDEDAKLQRWKEERELDKSLQDSFPASDPPAITQPTPSPEADDKQKEKTRRRSHG